MTQSDNVAIFWDYENCPAPSNASGYAIVNNITSLARPFGNVKVFKAYLEIPEQLPLSRFIALRSELQSSGVSLIDCPHNGRKEVADKMLIVDMLAYAIDTPSPATVVIITGDRDFAYALSILKLRGYRIILVTLPNAHASLTSQASTRYDWQSDIVNPVTTARNEPALTTRQRHRSTPSSDERNINPETPPPLWRNLPNTNNGLDIYEDRYCRKTPRRAQVFGQSTQFSERGFAGEAVESGGTQSSPSKDRGKPNEFQQRAQHLAASEPHTVNATQKQSDSFPNKDRTLFQIRPERVTQASAAMSFRNVFDPEDDSLSDMEFSPEDSPIIGPADGIPPPNAHDVDAALSKITEVEEISRLTLSDDRPASEPPLLLAHNIQSKPPNYGSPAYTQNTLISPQGSAGVSHPQSTPPVEVMSLLSSSRPTAAVPETAPFTPNTKLTRPSTTIPLTEPPLNPPDVPPNFSLLVRVLQGHRAKGYFLSYRTVVAGRISKGGTTYKKAGVNNYRQYLNLAEKEGIVELGGSGESAWVRLAPAWYTAVAQS